MDGAAAKTAGVNPLPAPARVRGRTLEEGVEALGKALAALDPPRREQADLQACLAQLDRSLQAIPVAGPGRFGPAAWNQPGNRY